MLCWIGIVDLVIGFAKMLQLLNKYSEYTVISRLIWLDKYIELQIGVSSSFYCFGVFRFE